MNIQKSFKGKFELERDKCGRGGDDVLCDAMNCHCGVDILRSYIESYIVANFAGRNMMSVTIYMDRDILKNGCLVLSNLPNSIRSLKRYLKLAGVDGLRAIGYVDIQRTEYACRTPRKPGVWHLHYHLVAISAEPQKAVYEKIKSVIPPSRQGKFPSRVVEVTALSDLVKYLAKYDDALKKKLITKNGQSQKTYSIIRGARKELDEYLKSITPFSRIVCIC